MTNRNQNPEPGPARRVSRRRFIRVSAAAAGFALLPASSRIAARAAQGASDGSLSAWRGMALGADAVLQIHHPDADAASRLIERCLAEVRRLERIFSLYREDSAIRRLNNDGQLAAPPLEFVELMARSAQFHDRTGGAFDPTVQPLWELYADHFSKPGADPNGPPQKSVERALGRVGFAYADIGTGKIAFARPGMAVTLNGIAQGYITDRVVGLLRQSGIAHALVDMGEIRGLGGRPGGGPWRIGLEDPRNPGAPAETVMLDNMAVATSGGYGTPIDPARRFNHMIDPASGRSGARYLSVSVIAPQATVADALSTAFTFLPLPAARRLTEELGIRAHFVLPDGTRISHGAIPV
jgi:FAD:protein FMN transferase